MSMIQRLTCPDCGTENAYTFEMEREIDERGPYWAASLIVTPPPLCGCPLKVGRINQLQSAAVAQFRQDAVDRRDDWLAEQGERARAANDLLNDMEARWAAKPRTPVRKVALL